MRRRMPVGSWNSKLKRNRPSSTLDFLTGKKAIQKFTAHQNSSCHKQAVLLLHQTTTAQPIVAQLSTAHQKQQQLARRCLIKAVQSTKYLLRQGLAKITPRMHQNAPFWAQKSKNFLGRGHSPLLRPFPRWGGGHVHVLLLLLLLLLIIIIIIIIMHTFLYRRKLVTSETVEAHLWRLFVNYWCVICDVRYYY